MYANASRGVGATSRRRNGGSLDANFDSLTVAGCFNCDDPTHIMRRCPRPINAVQAAQRKLAYFAKKNAGGRTAAATVLYELRAQLDAPASGDKSDIDAPAAHSLASDDEGFTDEALFETLLLTDGAAAAEAKGVSGGPDGHPRRGLSSGKAASFCWEEQFFATPPPADAENPLGHSIRPCLSASSFQPTAHLTNLLALAWTPGP